LPLHITRYEKSFGCSRVFGLGVSELRSGHHEDPRVGAYR